LHEKDPTTPAEWEDYIARALALIAGKGAQLRFRAPDSFTPEFSNLINATCLAVEQYDAQKQAIREAVGDVLDRLGKVAVEMRRSGKGARVADFDACMQKQWEGLSAAQRSRIRGLQARMSAAEADAADSRLTDVERGFARRLRAELGAEWLAAWGIRIARSGSTNGGEGG
jgi:hypothetical protein